MATAKMSVKEIREMLLFCAPDRSGQCDGCGKHSPLWFDSVSAGLFEFCSGCWKRQAVVKINRKAR